MYSMHALQNLLIYINDIYNSSNKLSFCLFANDTYCMQTKNLKSLEETVNNEVLKVSEWLNANKLTLNAKESINQPPLASLKIKTTTNFLWLKMGRWVTKCSVNIQAP